MNELALDQCFWLKVSTSSDFQTWLVRKTKFYGRAIKLVEDEKWHQRWYKDPETKKDSETDILLIFLDTDNHQRYALHIENKPPHGTWRSNQAENYHRRALNRMGPWRYADFQTVLLTPTSFISRHPTEVAKFDIVLRYEEVAVFIPEFEVSPHNSEEGRPSGHPAGGSDGTSLSRPTRLLSSIIFDYVALVRVGSHFNTGALLGRRRWFVFFIVRRLSLEPRRRASTAVTVPA